jgi:hypothetical protein
MRRSLPSSIPFAALVVSALAGCGSSTLPADSSFTFEASSATPSNALSSGAVTATVGQETDVYLSATFTEVGDYQVTLSAEPALPSDWQFEIANPAHAADGSHVIHVSAGDVANSVGSQVPEAVTFLVVPGAPLSSTTTLHLEITRNAGKTGRTVDLSLTTR